VRRRNVFFRQAGAALDATDEHGRTALHLAAAAENEAAVSVLVSAGARLHVQSAFLRTPLDEARAPRVRVLLTPPASARVASHPPAPPPPPRRDETYPLHAAVGAGGGLHALKQLLAAGGNPDALDSQRRTSLHVAAHAGQQHAAQRLLDAGAAVDVADGAGLTALMAACQRVRIPSLHAPQNSGLNKG
jgi:ankyrin repeat protein